MRYSGFCRTYFFYRFQPTLHVNGHYNSTETKWICQFLEHSAVLDFISTQEAHSIFGVRACHSSLVKVPFAAIYAWLAAIASSNVLGFVTAER